MRHATALIFAWVAFVAVVFISAYQHQSQELLIDEPDQIAAHAGIDDRLQCAADLGHS